MIITGYPGIGKSTLAKNNNKIIDLESKNFWNYEEIHGERTDIKSRHNDWFVYYGQIAIDLSKQGYTVFVSSHPQVREWLCKHTIFKSDISGEKFYAVFPSLTLKNDWIARLETRYNESTSDKDKRALDHAKECYDSDIKQFMFECGYNEEWYTNAIIIDNINYDLAEIISKLA